MKSSFFLNVVLAAALLCVSVRLATVSEEKAVEKTGGISAEVYQNIMTRSSVREYLDTSISDSQIDTLLHAGMAGPYGSESSAVASRGGERPQSAAADCRAVS